MKTSDKPFEGLLGNTVELRILERLIASPDLDFNVTELADMTHMSRGSCSKAVAKFLEWKMLTLSQTRGGIDYYQLNGEQPIVQAISTFNDALLIEMSPEALSALEEMDDNENEIVKDDAMSRQTSGTM
jgi:DNA-binding transcriptional regulator GbsR (MarR family)